MWEKNMRMIEQHNGEYSQGKHGFTMAMNAFPDMTNEEFKQLKNVFQNCKHQAHGENVSGTSTVWGPQICGLERKRY